MSRFSNRALQFGATGFRGVGLAARARRLSMRILLGALMTLGGANAAVTSERPSHTPDASTVTGFNDPLVKRWNRLREHMRMDDLMFSSCVEDETDG